MTGASLRRHLRGVWDAGGAQRGFTLMELLVVLGIMSMVVTAASDIFLLTSRSQRKIFGLERTQADARYTMEAMSREIRTGTIDYAHYATGGANALTTPDAELALIDSTNQPEKFKMWDATMGAGLCPDAASTPCLLVGTGPTGSVTWTPITPKGVVVRNVAFYVTPGTDPYVFDTATGLYASNLQPRVTVVMVLESTAERVNERSLVSIQTTVASRKYRR